MSIQKNSLKEKKDLLEVQFPQFPMSKVKEKLRRSEQ